MQGPAGWITGIALLSGHHLQHNGGLVITITRFVSGNYKLLNCKPGIGEVETLSDMPLSAIVRRLAAPTSQGFRKANLAMRERTLTSCRSVLSEHLGQRDW